jgi:hypothetical protein
MSSATTRVIRDQSWLISDFRVVRYHYTGLKIENMGGEGSFIKFDKLDGQWLSPIPSEREWQKQKLLEIFGHENAGPRWQYLNGLIHIALEHIESTKEEE